jgi:hypothetical protein
MGSSGFDNDKITSSTMFDRNKGTGDIKGQGKRAGFWVFVFF